MEGAGSAGGSVRESEPSAAGPLSGRTVLVTRPRGQAAALSARLRSLGAAVLEVPTIRIADPPDRGPLLRALGRLAEYDWLIFTSVNGVRKVAEALGGSEAASRALAGVAVAAIGPATARAVRSLGGRVLVVPERYRAEALVEALIREAGAVGKRGREGGQRPLEGARILLPRAAEARPVLPEGLEAAGAIVDEVPAYVTLPAEPDVAALRRTVEAGRLDWITFTSSSTVRRFVEMAGPETGGARVAAIGPITAATARELGIPADVVASEYTIPGLVQALADAVKAEG